MQPNHVIYGYPSVLKENNFFLKSKGKTNTKSKLQVPSGEAEGWVTAGDPGPPGTRVTLFHTVGGAKDAPYPCASHVTCVFRDNKR